MHRNDERPAQGPARELLLHLRVHELQGGPFLKGVELAVYALIYSYSQGKAVTTAATQRDDRPSRGLLRAPRDRCSARAGGARVDRQRRERKWGGRVTNMYAAALGPVAQAISRDAAEEAP